MVAVAGLERLGRLAELDQALEVDECTPAAGQGILVVQCRTDDQHALELLAAIDQPTIRAEAVAERAFLARLGGGCELPAGAVARVFAGGALELVGVVASADGKRLAREHHSGQMTDPAAAGVALAEALLPLAKSLLPGVPNA
jgi:hydroxymethylbilane synthase